MENNKPGGLLNTSDEEVKKFIESLKKADMVLNHQFDRFEKYIATIAEKNISEVLERLLKWEEDFEEDQYKRNFCQTTSNIFSCLFEYVRKKGIQSEEINEDFLSEQYTFMDYTFKLYQGQGCFWRIFKENRQIFQST